MRKILSLLIVCFFVLNGLGAVTGTNIGDEDNFRSDEIVFSQPVVHEKEEYVSIELTEATYSSWEADMPSLPVVSKVYTFPFGTRVDNVEVTFSDDLEQEVSKPIKPSPEVLIDSMIYNSESIKKSETLMTYSDIDVYPEHRFSYKTGAGLKGEEHVIYLAVHLYPVQYYPQENTIRYSEEATIDITYIPPEKPIVFPDEYDFLILAPSEFESALQPLVDHKNNLEPPVKTILVTLDNIPSQGGFDEQEDIKYYIKDAIENWGITYVLLVGSWVEKEDEPPDAQYAKFPIRKAYVPSDPYEDWFPSDLYYADIYNSTFDFSNWDFDGDGKYAEYRRDLPNIDVLPDVYLGKLPCNNVQEVNTVVEKIINYKAHNKMTKKILQVGGDSFTGDSVFEGEYANEKVLEKLPGYSTTQLWASKGILTKENVAKGFKNSVDFVDFCGHGSWASFATHPPNDKETWVPPKTIISPYAGFQYMDFDLYLVNNAKKLPVCVYKSCSNNKYTDSPTCFGWKTVSKRNGGGIATFAASGIGYGATGTDIVERTTGWMEVKTFEKLVSNKILGQVWGNCVTDYYNTFELELQFTDWKTMLEWSMFGDPTLVIEDGDDPEITSANRPVLTNILMKLLDHFPILQQIL